MIAGEVAWIAVGAHYTQTLFTPKDVAVRVCRDRKQVQIHHFVFDVGYRVFMANNTLGSG